MYVLKSTLQECWVHDSFRHIHGVLCDDSIERFYSVVRPISLDIYIRAAKEDVFCMHYPPREVKGSLYGRGTLHIQWEDVWIKNHRKWEQKECNLDRYQDAFREPFVKIPSIINFCILQHILCLLHQLFQYLLKYITASVERVCSP